MNSTNANNAMKKAMDALPMASVALLAAMGLVFLWRCPDIPCLARQVGAHCHFKHQLAWNVVGSAAFVGALKLGWSRWLKAAPFVAAGWLLMFAAAHFRPMVNGNLFLSLGPLRLNVMACLPFAAALFFAWLADRLKKKAMTILLLACLSGCAALTVRIVENHNRLARVAAFFRGDAESAALRSDAALARAWMQKRYAEALGKARWFAGNEEMLRENLMPESHTTGMPVSSALLFGKWFMALAGVFLGLFAAGVLRYFCVADSEAKKAFALVGGCGVLVPAVLAYGGCLLLPPMVSISAPLLSYAGTQVLIAWLTVGVIAGERKSSGKT